MLRLIIKEIYNISITLPLPIQQTHTLPCSRISILKCGRPREVRQGRWEDRLAEGSEWLPGHVVCLPSKNLTRLGHQGDRPRPATTSPPGTICHVSQGVGIPMILPFFLPVSHSCRLGSTGWRLGKRFGVDKGYYLDGGRLALVLGRKGDGWR